MAKKAGHPLLVEIRKWKHKDVQVKPGVVYRIKVDPIRNHLYEIVTIDGELVVIGPGTIRRR